MADAGGHWVSFQSIQGMDVSSHVPYKLDRASQERQECVLLGPVKTQYLVYNKRAVRGFLHRGAIRKISALGWSVPGVGWKAEVQAEP